MSRQANEARETRKGKSASKPKQSAKSSYVVFRPTKEERAAIHASTDTLGEVMLRLCEWAERDTKLVLGYRAENNAYFAHLVDKSTDWQDAITLSVFHANPETALRALDYALATKYSEFPDIQLSLFAESYDW